MMKTLVSSLLVTCFFTCIASIAFAQNSQLTGLVRDKTEAVVPAAAVTLTNTDTGTVLAAKTSKAGFYVFAAIVPGKYLLTGEAPGFAKTIIKDVKIDAAANVSQDIVLQVRSTSQSVDVESDPPAELTETTGAVSTVIDRPLIENMPLNGNSLQTLFELTPGVVTNASQGSAGNGGGISVNGQRPTSNYVSVDGTSANISAPFSNPSAMGAGIATSASGGTNGLLPVDAIEEYRMQTSSYSAEYGRTPGGQIEVKTRGGTNSFHGSLFENFRNQVMDAQDWFIGYYNALYAEGLKQQPLRMNDFGGTFGGPVLKNRLFFFVAHESLLMSQPQIPQKSDVPDQQTRASAASVFQPYINALPSGNGGPDPTFYVPGSDVYIFNFSNTIRDHSTSVRLDANLSHNLHAFFRANDAPSVFMVPATTYSSDNHINILTFTGGLSWGLSPTLTNDLNLNYSTFKNIQPFDTNRQALQSFEPAAAQVIDLSTTNVFFNTPWGFLTTGGPPQGSRLGQFNLVDTMACSVGKHTLKFGLDYRRIAPNFDAPDSVSLQTGYTPGDLQSGYLDNAGYGGYLHPPTIRTENTSLFADDNWRVSEKLTLNLGLRWEYNPPPTASYPGMLAMQGDPTNPSSITLAPPGTPLYKTRYTNFAPRLGFAYAMRAGTRFGTVLRGGGGTFFDTGQAAAAAQAGQLEYPYYVSFITPTSIPYSTLNVGQLQSAASGGLPNYQVYLTSPNLVSPRTYDWSLTIDQNLGGDTVLSSSYIGNRSNDLLKEGAYQALTPSLTPSSGYLYVYTNGEQSSYNALQMQLRHRMTSGLNFLASYSCAHAIDTGSNDFSSVGGFQQNRKANSDNDIRHIFSSAIHYAPHGTSKTRFLKGLTGGWGVDTIVLLQSASPFSVFAYNSSDVNRYDSYADVVPGVPLVIPNPTAPGGKQLNLAAFACAGGGVPPCALATRDGDSPRNGYRLFGLHQFDLAASRNWPVWEGASMIFRVDAFNVLNIPNFAGICNNLYCGSTFGEASGTYAGTFGTSSAGGTGLNSVFSNGGARSLQLSLRMRF
jgi:hypothetical protein